MRCRLIRKIGNQRPGFKIDFVLDLSLNATFGASFRFPTEALALRSRSLILSRVAGWFLSGQGSLLQAWGKFRDPPKIEVFRDIRIWNFNKERTGQSSPRLLFPRPIGIGLESSQRSRGKTSQQAVKFIHGQSCLANDLSESSFGDLPMIGDYDSAIRFSIQS